MKIEYSYQWRQGVVYKLIRAEHNIWGQMSAPYTYRLSDMEIEMLDTTIIPMSNGDACIYIATYNEYHHCGNLMKATSIQAYDGKFPASGGEYSILPLPFSECYKCNRLVEDSNEGWYLCKECRI